VGGSCSRSCSHAPGARRGGEQEPACDLRATFRNPFVVKFRRIRTALNKRIDTTRLELAPRYWRITRARLDRKELDREIGWLTVPEPPLPPMLPSSALDVPPSPAP
jgi:hypothetical protein